MMIPTRIERYNFLFKNYQCTLKYLGSSFRRFLAMCEMDTRPLRSRSRDMQCDTTMQNKRERSLLMCKEKSNIIIRWFFSTYSNMLQFKNHEFHFIKKSNYIYKSEGKSITHARLFPYIVSLYTHHITITEKITVLNLTKD